MAIDRDPGVGEKLANPPGTFEVGLVATHGSDHQLHMGMEPDSLPEVPVEGVAPHRIASLAAMQLNGLVASIDPDHYQPPSQDHLVVGAGAHPAHPEDEHPRIPAVDDGVLGSGRMTFQSSELFRPPFIQAVSGGAGRRGQYE